MAIGPRRAHFVRCRSRAKACQRALSWSARLLEQILRRVPCRAPGAISILPCRGRVGLPCRRQTAKRPTPATEVCRSAPTACCRLAAASMFLARVGRSRFRQTPTSASPRKARFRSCQPCHHPSRSMPLGASNWSIPTRSSWSGETTACSAWSMVPARRLIPMLRWFRARSKAATSTPSKR